MLRLYVAAGAAVLLTLVLLPIEWADRLVLPGKVLPGREWLLLRGTEGAMSALTRDGIDGTASSYAFSRFERGDVVRFALRPGLRLPGPVAAGDSIGTVASNAAEREVARLGGELAAAQAALRMAASGEKQALIAEAQERLSAAEEQARHQRLEVNRLRPLRERKLVSEQEYALAESQQRVLEANVAMARAAVAALSSGAKAEALDLARAQAATLEREIAALSERAALLTLQAPFGGLAIPTHQGDTLLIVRDTSALLVVMPVRLQDRGAVVPGTRVDVDAPGLGTLRGVVRRYGNQVFMMDGQQVVMADVVVRRPPAALMPGALVTCTVVRGRLTPLGAVGRFARSLASAS